MFKYLIFVFVLLSATGCSTKSEALGKHKSEIKKQYYTNGDIKREIEYTNGKKDGKSKFFLKGNRLFAMAEYKMGIRNGVYVEYDEDKNISLKNTYKNGIQIGRSLHYKNKKLANGEYIEKTYDGEKLNTYKEGLLFGLQKECKSSYCSIQEVDSLGNSIYTRKVDGITQDIAHFKNNVLDGEMVRYLSNGKISSKVTYKNGKKDGLHTFYHYDKESISSITKYKDGIIVEDTIFYDENGHKKNMKNPYNGTYRYDLKNIKSEAVKKDIQRAKERGFDQFRLKINEALVSIFGYQTGQPIRMRLYTSCILENGDLDLINGADYRNKEYCIKHDQDTLVLKLKRDKTDKYKLICENCEEHGFPGSWIRN